MSPAPLRHLAGLAPEPALSLESVCRSHGRQIARWAERLGGPGLDTDETVQEVLLVVARRLGEFRGDAKLSTWLFRITTHVLANQRRALKRRHTFSWTRLTRRIEELVPADQPGPAAGLERADATRRFYRVLDELPERYRQVLILFELEELGTDDIARLIERPPATVRVWLHRARARFTVVWRQQHKENQE